MWKYVEWCELFIFIKPNFVIFGVYVIFTGKYITLWDNLIFD